MNSSFVSRMFRFPIRIYEPSGEEDTNATTQRWFRGWKRIFLDDISSIEETYYVDSDIDDIIKTESNASYIVLNDKSGIILEYVCDWNIKTLENKIDEYFNKHYTSEEQTIDGEE